MTCAGGLGVYVNGLRMCEGLDYTASGGVVRPIAGTRMQAAVSEPDCIVLVDYWRV